MAIWMPKATLTLASVTFGMTKDPNGTLLFILSNGVWIATLSGRIKEKRLKSGMEAKLFL
jgi:hypothetical protein